jgi:hypothetical protein
VTPRAITVLSSSRALRRSVGPLAWVLLEELALGAENRPDGFTVETNVRDLGATLNVGKDTVAKALGRLADLGLLHPQTRRVAGRYAGCAYVVDIEACHRAGIVISQAAVVSSPCPVAPCPVQPDAAEADTVDQTPTGWVGASPASHEPDGTGSASPSLFDLPDLPDAPPSHPLTAPPEPSTTSSLPIPEPDFPTPPPPSLTPSCQPDALAPGVRRAPVNVAGSRAGRRSALNGNLNGEAGSGC